MPIASAKGDAPKARRHEQGLTKISFLRPVPLNGGSGGIVMIKEWAPEITGRPTLAGDRLWESEVKVPSLRVPGFQSVAPRTG